MNRRAWGGIGPDHSGRRLALASDSAVACGLRSNHSALKRAARRERRLKQIRVFYVALWLAHLSLVRVAE